VPPAWSHPLEAGPGRGCGDAARGGVLVTTAGALTCLDEQGQPRWKVAALGGARWPQQLAGGALCTCEGGLLVPAPRRRQRAAQLERGDALRPAAAVERHARGGRRVEGQRATDVLRARRHRRFAAGPRRARWRSRCGGWRALCLRAWGASMSVCAGRASGVARGPQRLFSGWLAIGSMTAQAVEGVAATPRPPSGRAVGARRCGPGARLRRARANGARVGDPLGSEPAAPRRGARQHRPLRSWPTPGEPPSTTVLAMDLDGRGAVETRPDTGVPLGSRSMTAARPHRLEARASTAGRSTARCPAGGRSARW